ncbi:MAG: transglutaminase-like domain-containing protein, partial [Planctomycetota bacterium]|nr:transglutaminase-like domain-containing protein [Planctomycetota bacterium]
MQFALNLQARTLEVAAELERALNAPGNDLASAAFTIARVEYPALDTTRYLERLDEMAARASLRLGGAVTTSSDSITAFNEFLYDEEGFTGNREHYDDPRNSYLNEVLDRRTGIPISLAVL